MRFQLLGPVQASDDGRCLDLGPRKQRALLALLLLEDRPVSLARAVDELWADPPATAPKMIQMYVSGLRKALGADSIRTTRAGYELDANGADVDVRRFRSLRETAESEPALAASVLREALELWQGEPLSDLVGEPFADRERARLEDERLDAEEDRIEAELANGARVSVGELEALVAQHPYRERLRRLLVLALYRAGRQADALAAYQEGARVLRDELGLEPSSELRELELAVLRQDARLDVPAARTQTGRRRGRRRLVLAATSATALAVALALAWALRGGATQHLTANHAAALDPRTERISTVVPVGLEPTTAATVGNRLYVASGEDDTVLVLDAVTGRRIRSIPVGGTVTALSGAGRFLWAVEFYDREVLRIPIDGVGEATRVRLPYGRRGSPSLAEHPVAVEAGSDGAWVGTDMGRLFFVGRGGGLRVIGALDRPIRALAYAPPFLWIAQPLPRGFTGDDERPGTVVRLDLRTKATESVPVGLDPSALTVVGSAVWVATQASGKVFRIDNTTAITTVIDLHTNSLAEGPCSSGLAVGCPGSMDSAGGFLWVPSARDRVIYRIDMQTNSVTRIRTHGDPVGATSAAGRVWVVAA